MDKNTEERILISARKVFIMKGYDGARMQEIADVAGINKSLLHYYFRSKDKIFEAIFYEAMDKFIPKLSIIMSTEKELKEKISHLVDAYIDMLIKNPYLPNFILQEINRNPEKILNLMFSKGFEPKKILSILKKDISGNNLKMNAEQFLVNVLSLCIFPFAAKPIIKGLLFENSQKKFDKFIIQRKKYVKEFIFKNIMI